MKGMIIMADSRDRRVRKTEEQLTKGLTKLMREKSIKDITVRELADEVDFPGYGRCRSGRIRRGNS